MTIHPASLPGTLHGERDQGHRRRGRRPNGGERRRCQGRQGAPLLSIGRGRRKRKDRWLAPLLFFFESQQRRETPSKVRRRCFCRRIRSLETPLPHDVHAGREKERARRGAGCLASSEATAPTPLLHCRGDKFPPSSVALQMKEKGSVGKREPLAGIGEESCSLLTGILRWPLL
nr:hypothetical protein Iba_scaffold1957CG0010 [Ipomoea batatas]